MDFETVVRIILFCGITGFAFFCASYAFHVWYRRNVAMAGTTLRRPRSHVMARLLHVCILLGVVAVMAAAIWRELSPREGVLKGDGIFTVRAESNMTLEYIAQAPSVQAGEVVARFRSPERQAEVAEYKLKKEILQAQKEVLKTQPPVPDHELVRHIQNLYEDERQLAASIRYLIPEQAVVAREQLRDRLDRVERLNSLKTSLAETRKQTLQAAAELEKARRYQQRAENLASQKAASTLEAEDNTTEVEVMAEELARLQERARYQEIEIAHLESGLRQFAGITETQDNMLSEEIADAKMKLRGVRSEYAERSKLLSQDLERAELLRAHQLRQLDLEIEQCDAELQGLHEVLEVKAPFSSRVAFVDRAPRTALPLAPVVVLAPEGGFRFQTRLPERELPALKDSNMVPMRLVNAVLHHKFTGRLSDWEPLPEEPGYVVVELVCQPPPAAVRDLVSGGWDGARSGDSDAVQAVLLWRAPLTLSPLFNSGAGLLGVGFLGMVILRLRTRPHPAPEAVGQPSGSTGLTLTGQDAIRPLFEPELMASGALSRNLEQLGVRFREAIRRQEVTEELIRALEWALDRHQMRAIHHLNIGFDHDEQLPEDAKRYFERWSDDALALEKETSHESAHRRVAQILRMIRPDLIIRQAPRPEADLWKKDSHPIHRSSDQLHRFSGAALHPGSRREERMPS